MSVNTESDSEDWENLEIPSLSLSLTPDTASEKTIDSASTSVDKFSDEIDTCEEVYRPRFNKKVNRPVAPVVQSVKPNQFSEQYTKDEKYRVLADKFEKLHFKSGKSDGQYRWLQSMRRDPEFIDYLRRNNKKLATRVGIEIPIERYIAPKNYTCEG